MSEQIDLLSFVPPPVQGATFDSGLDGERLSEQCRRVFELMRDGAWRTLAMIGEGADAPEASASARCRDLRRWLAEHCAGTVERKRDEHIPGLHWYRVVLNRRVG